MGVYTYASTANFIYGNYKQALEIIKNDGAAFEIMAKEFNITAEDCYNFLVAERKFLSNAIREPAEMTQKIDYIEALLTLDKAAYAISWLSTVFAHS